MTEDEEMTPVQITPPKSALRTPKHNPVSTTDEVAVTTKPETVTTKVQFQEKDIRVRYNLRLNIPASLSPDIQILETLKEVFTKSKELVSNLTIHPWYAASTVGPISRIRQLPEDFASLKNYYTGVFPRAKGGMIYGQIHLRISVEVEDLIQSLRWWLNNKGHGLYQRSLQVEKVKFLGWLLYSSRATDTKALAATLSLESGIDMGCRYREVYIGQSTQGERSRAIHIEVVDNNTANAKSFLYARHGRKESAPFPTGEMYRLVPPFNSLLNAESQTRCIRTVEKQIDFGNAVKTIKTWKFSTLDYTHLDLPMTLRFMIANIMWDDKTGTARPLFLTADQSYDKDGFIMTVHPEMECEERVVTSGLYPYLITKYGEQVSSLFTTDNVSSHKGHQWNTDKGGIVTAEDELLDGSDDEDNWMDFSSPNSQGGMNLTILSSTNKLPMVSQGILENDSVGTIQTKGSGNNPKRARIEEKDATSVSSEVTMESRLSTLELDIGTIKGNMKEILQAIQGGIKGGTAQ